MKHIGNRLYYNNLAKVASLQISCVHTCRCVKEYTPDTFHCEQQDLLWLTKETPSGTTAQNIELVDACAEETAHQQNSRVEKKKQRKNYQVWRHFRFLSVHYAPVLFVFSIRPNYFINNNALTYYGPTRVHLRQDVDFIVFTFFIFHTIYLRQMSINLPIRAQFQRKLFWPRQNFPFNSNR